MGSAKEIEVGGTGEIRATLKTKGYQGKIAKYVRVITNDPKNELTTLKLTGFIVAELIVDRRHVNFGSVRSGEKASQEIKLTIAEGSDITVEGVEDNSAYITTELERSSDREFIVEVSLDGEPPIGPFSKRLTIKSSSEKNPKLTIPLYANIKGDVTVSPQVVLFVIPNTGEILERTLIVRSEEKTDLVIGDVESSSDEIVATVREVEKGIEFEVDVRLVLDEEIGEERRRMRENLTIHTNHPKHRTISIPIYANLGGASSTKMPE